MKDNIKEIRRKYDMHFYEGYEDDVHEAIGFLLSEIDRMQENNDKLIEFAHRVIRTGWKGDVCGADIQEWGEEFGLLRRAPYDPEKHGEIDGAEPGDEIYEFTEILER